MPRPPTNAPSVTTASERAAAGAWMVGLRDLCSANLKIGHERYVTRMASDGRGTRRWRRNRKRSEGHSSNWTNRISFMRLRRVKGVYGVGIEIEQIVNILKMWLKLNYYRWAAKSIEIDYNRYLFIYSAFGQLAAQLEDQASITQSTTPDCSNFTCFSLSALNQNFASLWIMHIGDCRQPEKEKRIDLRFRIYKLKSHFC